MRVNPAQNLTSWSSGAGAPCRGQASGSCVSGAVEVEVDPWGSSVAGWGYCGALEEWVGCPIATPSEGRACSPPPEAPVLPSAPWSSSHTPLYTPWRDSAPPHPNDDEWWSSCSQLKAQTKPPSRIQPYLLHIIILFGPFYRRAGASNMQRQWRQMLREGDRRTGGRRASQEGGKTEDEAKRTGNNTKIQRLK